ncbi:hypothetical protein [Tenacibaculum sp.]|uniref:hypothetical protein n=1 Tax=Tenacibaculum sp. TaxID=1906242 RepID=UPI003AA97703
MNKRNQVTNFLKLSLFLFGISILLWSCEKENTTAISDPEAIEISSKIKSKYVSGNEIPEIMNLLQPNSKVFYKTNLITTPIGEIEIDNILQVIDSLGNENYSFLLMPKNPKPNSIFNLVISTSSKKEKHQMAIFEYKMSENFASSYYNESKSFSQFEGTIYKYPFNYSTYSNLLSKGDTCVQNVDEIVVCDETIITSGGAGSSGGGTGSNDSLNHDFPNDGNSNGGTSSGGSVTVQWICDDDGTSQWSSSQCNAAGHGGTWVITLHPSLNRSAVNRELTCCDNSYVEGTVGVNLMTEAISDIINCIGYLDSNELEYLSSTLTTFAIRNFLDQNDCSPEAKTFVKQAIKALINGGEVDFDDRIINELIGDAKCIFKKLKGLSLYKGTIKQFENSNYDLIITYGACNSGEACTNDEFIDLGIIEIKLRGLNNTYLGFAATLLHEGIHAELFKYVHERDKGVDVNDRPNLMYHYFQLKGKVDPRYLDSRVQHEHMADKYVKPIAEAIRELDNNRYPLDYYLGFAWDGLRPYGINQYLDSNGNYVELDDTGFTEKQALVNSTSSFNSQTFDKNCN